MVRTRHSRDRSRDRSKERSKRQSKSSSEREKNVKNRESISKETNNNSNFQFKDDCKISKIVNKNPDIPISNSDPAKIKRELYVTNFPEILIPSQLTELMNTAMIAINANIKSGNPIVSTWINPEANYAICEFRTEEEANNAFKLDGISILGKNIKIGRPQNPGEENIHQQISKTLINSEDMFPTLTSFEKDLNNPYLNRNVNVIKLFLDCQRIGSFFHFFLSRSSFHADCPSHMFQASREQSSLELRPKLSV